MIEERQKRFEALADPPVRRDIVAVVVPGARGRVVAQVDRDERDARFDEPSGQERLLAPKVLAVSLADPLRLLRQVEGISGPAADQQVDRLLPVMVHRLDGRGAIDLAAQAVEVRKQRPAVVQPTVRQSRRQPEEVGLGRPAGVLADVRIDGQLRRTVGDERVVPLTQVSGVGDVASRGLERHVGRHAGAIGAVVLGHDRADRRIHLAVGVDPRSGGEMAGLEDLVRLVVAFASVHRSDDREPVEHRRLLRQVLAELDAGELRRDHAERSPVLERPAGLRVPGIDLARSAGHPEQDHGLIAADRPARLGRPGPFAEQARQAQPGQTRQARLDHVPPAGDHDVLPAPWDS